MAKKYLSLERLEEYHELIKGVIDEGDTSILSSAKSHANSGDTTTLASAKSYTDEQLLNKANTSHTHEISDINNLQTTLDELDEKSSEVATFIVTITKNSSSNEYYTADKTFAEILEAIHNGKNVLAKLVKTYNNTLPVHEYKLATYSEESIEFSFSITYGKVLNSSYVVIFKNDTIEVKDYGYNIGNQTIGDTNKTITGAINEIFDDINEISNSIDNKPGIKVAEGTNYTINGSSYTSKFGAEIFNDYDNNKAIGSFAHAEGTNTTALGEFSHAEGYGTMATSVMAHAEGQGTIASGNMSHAEGQGTIASGNMSHAEGQGTTASGERAHSEGQATIASGYISHAEGYGTTVSGSLSHAEGCNTIASGTYQHVQGKFNIDDVDAEGNALDTYAHIVGNGTADTKRSNAHTLAWDGTAWYKGDVYVGGTSQYEGSKLVTEIEVDTKLENKAKEAKTYTDTVASGKADADHNHDEDYDALGAADTALASAKTYTDSAATKVKNDLLNGAGDAYDTLKELGDLIDVNVDAIEALETVAAGKADKVHTHDDRYYTETEVDAKIDAIPDASFVVTVTKNGDTYTADKTFAEMTEAYNNGQVLDVCYGFGLSTHFCLMMKNSAFMMFVCSGGVEFKLLIFNSDNTINYNEGSVPSLEDLNALETVVNGKANASHDHNDLYYTQTQVDTKLESKANTSHTHTIENVIGLQSALDGKAAASHGTHVTFDSTNKPKMDGTAAFGTSTNVARADHVHPTDTSRASQTALDSLEVVVSGKANASHTHTISEVTNLQSALDAKATQSALNTHANNADIHFTADERTKLAGIEAGANKTIVDSELNASSENPVQNKVINTALASKSQVQIIIWGDDD